MNEREFANHIKQELNYGTGQVDGRVLNRLKQARENALERYATRTAQQPVFAFAGAHGSGMFGRKWLPVITLLLVLLGGVLWQQQNMGQAADEDVDAALLASDLPLNAFVDQNFHLWLDHSAQH